MRLHPAALLRLARIAGGLLDLALDLLGRALQGLLRAVRALAHLALRLAHLVLHGALHLIAVHQDLLRRTLCCYDWRAKFGFCGHAGPAYESDAHLRRNAKKRSAKADRRMHMALYSRRNIVSH